MKKKKKKKTAFDLDGAMAAEAEDQTDPVAVDENNLVDDNVEEELDLEDFGKKKKKKKKKPFNEAELDAQPEEGEESNEVGGEKTEDDLDIDFASSKKKKRTKKKDLNDILDQDEGKDEDKENGKHFFYIHILSSDKTFVYMPYRLRGNRGDR